MISSKLLAVVAIVFILVICGIGVLFQKNTPRPLSPQVVTVEVVKEVTRVVILTPTVQPTQTATDIPIPTKIIVPTADVEQQYAQRLVGWLQDIGDANDTIVQSLRQDRVNEAELRAALRTINRVQTELHTTIPPALYRKTHAQLTECVDLYVGALLDYAKNDIEAGNAKLDRAAELMKTLPETMPQRQ